MLDEFLDKKVKVTLLEGGSLVENFNVIVLEVKDNLLKIQDVNGKVEIINTNNPSFVKIELQD